jgi:Ser/Thr protein kinase RdoA (MazF antagonist)
MGRMLGTRMPEARAAEVARAYWGVDAAARRLDSEHDDAFRLSLPDGTARFLRVSAPDPVAAEASFLTAILAHLARVAPELPVQRVVPALDGSPEVPLDGRLVRMTTFLDGRLLSEVRSTPALRRDIGATLARLSRALRGFTHPAARRTHLWDVQNAHQLRPLLHDLAATGTHVDGGVAEALDHFDAVVRPALAGATTQVIHGDFHGENLLVAADGVTITGVLDFGDSLTGPVAMDVAVAACYQLGADGADLLTPALDVVAGYHAVDPLRPADLPLIRELITLRLATRIVVSQWNAAREPGNSGYLLRRTAQAVEHFRALRAMPPAAVLARLRAACDLG